MTVNEQDLAVKGEAVEQVLTLRVSFVKRLFGFPELRDWLLAAGFSTP
jgi:hypothetical protein